MLRFVRKAWVYVVGGALFVWPPVQRALEWLGTADLIISHYIEPGWMGGVIEWLLNPPPWASPLATAAGAAIICWQLSRSRRRPEPTTGPAPPRRPEPAAPDAPRPVPAAARAAGATPPPAAPPPAPEPDWGKLYEMADDGRHVRLRFLPDTENQQDDAALLVVLGYKVMAGLARVRAGAVGFETQRAMHDAPNSPIPEPLRHLSFMRRAVQQPDLAQRHVDGGLLRRVALSEGGVYELTAEGEETARIMARGLIRRA